MLLTACAQQVPPGYGRYVGAAFGGEAIPSGGVTSFEVVSGARLGTFVGLEATARADVGSTLDVADDPPCSGVAHQAHWASLGARLWFDLLRTPNVDIGIAPSMMVGLVHDVASNVYVPGGCLQQFMRPVYSTNVGAAFIPALAIGVEIHEHSFGLRAWFEAGSHLTLGGDAMSTISVGGFVGPLIRY